MLGRWLMGCMTGEVLKQACSFDTSSDACVKLEKAHGLKFRARAIQVKEEL